MLMREEKSEDIISFLFAKSIFLQIQNHLYSIQLEAYILLGQGFAPIIALKFRIIEASYGIVNLSS